MRDHVGVVLDAESAGSEFFCGGDRDLAVARAEIDHIVLRLRLRHVQHALDDLVRSRHPYHVLALLADMGFEVLLLGVRCTRHDEQRGAERRQEALGIARSMMSSFCLSGNCAGTANRQQRAVEVYSVSYRASAAWSASRERSPRCRVTCPECDQPFMRSTT